MSTSLVGGGAWPGAGRPGLGSDLVFPGRVLPTIRQSVRLRLFFHGKEAAGRRAGLNELAGLWIGWLRCVRIKQNETLANQNVLLHSHEPLCEYWIVRSGGAGLE
jgi:hypothetical protein